MVQLKLNRLVKRIFFIILGCFFLGLIVFIFFKESGGNTTYNSVIEENKLLMSGLKLLYVIDNSSYVNLLSKTAMADKAVNSVAMNDVSLEYNGENMKINARADNGRYELERIVYVFGNISGTMNDMRFDAGENGILTYDYKSGKGDVKNGITLHQGSNSINAGIAEFDVEENFVRFKDNVTVDYDVTEK